MIDAAVAGVERGHRLFHVGSAIDWRTRPAPWNAGVREAE